MIFHTWEKFIKKLEVDGLLTNLTFVNKNETLDSKNHIVFCIRYATFGTYPKNLEHNLKRQLNQLLKNNLSILPIELKDFKTMFDNDTATIEVGDRKCKLPLNKNEHCFCRLIFSKKVGESLEASDIFFEMTGEEIDNIRTKNKLKSVQDTMYSINNKVRKAINTNDDLFEWRNKLIIRRF